MDQPPPRRRLARTRAPRAEEASSRAPAEAAANEVPQAPPREIELKLTLGETAARRLAHSPFLTSRNAEGPRTQKLHSIYFDTPDRDLQHAGAALRLRRAGGRWVQTLKQGGGAAGGLHSRDEIEHWVKGRELDLGALPPDKLSRRLAEWQHEALLQPRFETRFMRKTWMLRTEAGDVVECALDRGSIVTPDGTQSARICEIELELKSGSVGALFALARALARECPLELEDRSKAERGYALLEGGMAEPSPVRAARVELAESDTLGSGLQKVVSAGLAHLHANRRGMLAATRPDPEFVHQMRVALRRLRTALTVFGKPDPELQALTLKPRMQELARLLGDARDWDVFIETTLAAAQRALPDEPWSALTVPAGSRQREACAHVEESLRSPAYFELALDLGHLAATADARTPLQQPLPDYARRVLRRRHKQLRAQGEGIDGHSPEARHAVRIAAKKMRYASEFFESLFPGKSQASFLRRFVKLQDELGALNDRASARRLLDNSGAPSSQEMLRLQGVLTGWWAASDEASLARLAKRWRAVEGAGRFWDPADA
jgi:inorganic triphosphatase YgiF